MTQAPCPISGCRNKRKKWQVMCWACWRRVDPKQQKLVMDLYRTARGSREHQVAVVVALRQAEAAL